jgi:hypothetical protein
MLYIVIMDFSIIFFLLLILIGICCYLADRKTFFEIMLEIKENALFHYSDGALGFLMALIGVVYISINIFLKMF